jgi:hypothetical protein
MRFYLKHKDKLAWCKVLSNICGNLAAVWYGFVLITPGISLSLELGDIFTLTRSVFAGILLTWLSFKLERISR